MAEEKKTPVAGAKNPFAKEKLPDARITWIQSYPRSGNAWVRAFLYTYMAEKDTIDLQAMGRAFSHDSSAFIFERLMREEVSKLKPADIGEKRTEFLLRACRSSKNDLVMRSHLLQTDWGGQPTFLPHFSRAAIVIVRDPRDIAISTAADMEIPVDAAIANMAQPQFALLSKGTTPQPIGSWTRNVLSWLSRPSMPRLFVRYEDLIENPRKEFMRIIAFMNLRLDFDQLDKALEATTFEKLAEAEKEDGFGGAHSAEKPFFRSGQVGQWRDGGLSLGQIQSVEQACAQAMVVFGYEPETVRVLSADEAEAARLAQEAEGAKDEVVIEDGDGETGEA